MRNYEDWGLFISYEWFVIKLFEMFCLNHISQDAKWSQLIMLYSFTDPV